MRVKPRFSAGVGRTPTTEPSLQIPFSMFVPAPFFDVCFCRTTPDPQPSGELGTACQGYFGSDSVSGLPRPARPGAVILWDLLRVFMNQRGGAVPLME